ncbi:MAG: DUF1684 domain-containing protein [Anaerolineales bacterium]
MTATYENEIREWRHSLDEALRRPYGWLSLAGLYWLEEGPATVGSSPNCDHLLPPTAPSQLGTVTFHGGMVRFRADDDVEITIDGQPGSQAVMAPDTSGSPTVIDVGPLRLMLIERDDLVGLRLWDSNRSIRDAFPGRRWYPLEASARIHAKWLAADAGSALTFPNELGQTMEEPIAGRLRFELQGVETELAALPAENGELFVIFADSTTGVETYSGGRYLTIPAPEDGQAIVDFNRAYNPPCAFTPFATCTLPPAANRLSIAVNAGELSPVGVDEQVGSTRDQEPPPAKR